MLESKLDDIDAGELEMEIKRFMEVLKQGSKEQLKSDQHFLTYIRKKQIQKT